MQQIKFSSNQPLCFRRWSRNKYAAFYSLGKVVMIGQLKNSIANASLTKPNQTRIPSDNLFICKNTEDGLLPDKNPDSVTLLIVILILNLFLPFVSPETDAKRHNISDITLKRIYPVLQSGYMRFLF